MTPAEKVASKKKPRRKSLSGNTQRPRKWVCKLREKREALGLSMRDVAEHTGYTVSTLFEIENGTDPQLTTAMKLAEFFGCMVNDLWPSRLKDK